MKKILSSLFLLLILFSASAQSDKARKKARAIKMEALTSKMIYPLINAGKWSGVVPVINPTEIPDQSMNFKLLFELMINNPDSISKDINHGLTEICRIINLHVASGIPVKNITPVIVVHGPALFPLYNNNNYKKKYKVDNPNISVLQELISKTGVKIIACGQAMAFLDVKSEDMMPEVKVSVTAITVLSNYGLKGYKLYSISEDRQ